MQPDTKSARPTRAHRPQRGRALIGALLLLAVAAGITACDTKLTTGQTLASGKYIESPNKAFRATMQTDGNLVITRNSDGAVMWHAGTNGNPGATLSMQGDGNLVIYRQNGSAAWASSSTGTPDATVFMQDDGNLVVRTADGRPTWSATGGLTGNSQATLGSNQALQPEDYLQSTDGSYRLTMQTDGNLVLQSLPSGTPVWHTGTDGNPGGYAVLQPDGNFVVYTSNGQQALWYTRTTNAIRLGLQPDGNLVLHGPSGPVWSRMGGLTEPVGTRGQTQSNNGGAPGNCTWWVYERAKDTIGTYPTITGDAWKMGTNAAARGWTVTTTPRARSILVRQPGVGGASSFGHVMWVKQVSGSQVLISDMNASGLYSVRDNVWVTVASSDRFILID